MSGWSDGLGPYTPVIKDGFLWGRGAADDGYSIFAALTAIRLCKKQVRLFVLCSCVLAVCSCLILV